MEENLTIQEKDLNVVAEKVLEHLSLKDNTKADVVLLVGDLGSGKTTFTQIFAKCLGVKEDVHSPTFILKKEYKTSEGKYKKLIHIDAYRFNDPKEAKVLKLENDLEDSNAIILIEWPSKMKEIKAEAIISFDVIDDDTREVNIKYE